MKLRELEAEFIRYEKVIADEYHGRINEDGSKQYGGFEITQMPIVQTLFEAQGIMFLCPHCFVKNNGSKGTHSVQVTFADRGVLDSDGTHNEKGYATRWLVIGGAGLDDLQLSPSILLESGCKWHGFVGSNGVPPGHAQ